MRAQPGTRYQDLLAQVNVFFAWHLIEGRSIEGKNKPLNVGLSMSVRGFLFLRECPLPFPPQGGHFG